MLRNDAEKWICCQMSSTTFKNQKSMTRKQVSSNLLLKKIIKKYPSIKMVLMIFKCSRRLGIRRQCLIVGLKTDKTLTLTLEINYFK